MRMTSDQGSGLATGGNRANRVGDLNPEEIENIEIVKGPSASTLYGTDAANGVIVITTKRGRAGATQWDFHAERSEIRDRNDYYPNYQLVGRSVAAGSPLRKCRSYEIAAGTCIFDSAYELNILTTPDLTFIGPGHRNVGGASLSGGNSSVRSESSARASPKRVASINRPTAMTRPEGSRSPRCTRH